MEILIGFRSSSKFGFGSKGSGLSGTRISQKIINEKKRIIAPIIRRINLVVFLFSDSIGE